MICNDGALENMPTCEDGTLFILLTRVYDVYIIYSCKNGEAKSK